MKSKHRSAPLPSQAWQLRGSVAVIVLACATAHAQYEISWHSIDGGGAMSSTGGTFSLDGTIGQPDAQTPPVMFGGTFELTGGFWPVANVCYCLSDMNGDGQKNGADVRKFVGCVLTGGDCSCADVDQVNGLTLSDTDAFVIDLLADNSCP